MSRHKSEARAFSGETGTGSPSENAETQKSRAFSRFKRNGKGSSKLDPAPIFAALGDETRLSLLAKLSDGQMQSLVKLSADTSLTRQAISKHLRVLENAGLVSSTRIGRESLFAFKPEPIAEVRAYLESVSLQWDDALARLQAFVER
jgi:DNA-binding transcriptional ArsR family regulator